MNHPAQLPLAAPDFHEFGHCVPAPCFSHPTVWAAKRSANEEPNSSQNAGSGETAKSIRLPDFFHCSTITAALFSSAGRASQMTCFAGGVSGHFAALAISRYNWRKTRNPSGPPNGQLRVRNTCRL